MISERARSLLLNAVQYVLGLAALIWLASRIDWTQVKPLLLSIPARTLVLVALVTLLGQIARFYTWHVLLEEVGDVSLLTSAKVDLSVNFINQLFPSRLSGNSAAPLIIRRLTTETISWESATAVAGLRTGLYALLYGLVSVSGLLLVGARLPPSIGLLIALSTVLYLGAGGVLLLSFAKLSLLQPIFDRLDDLSGALPYVGRMTAVAAAKLPQFASESTAVFRRLIRNPRTLLVFSGSWAGIVVVASGVRVAVLLSALGYEFEPLLALPLYVVMAYSVTLLPLTPGGIGVTEVTASLVFTSLGVPQEIIVPVILVDRVLGAYLPALAGAFPTIGLGLTGLQAD